MPKKTLQELLEQYKDELTPVKSKEEIEEASEEQENNQINEEATNV